MQKFDLNPDFQKAIKIVTETKKNLFVTGKAGTGKSTFLRYLIDNCNKKKVVLAPTGLAAINVGGQTIHSFFKIPPGASLQDARKAGAKLRKQKLFEKLELLIIDEISMVRADLLDMVDVALKAAKESVEAFGGVQIVLIGDLYQLPPVVRSDEAKILSQIYKTPYFFSAEVFKYLLESLGENLEYVELSKIYRQTDSDFIQILNKVRFKDIEDKDLDKLNQKLDLNWQDLDDKYVILTSRNDQATKLNQTQLDQLTSKSKTYKGEINGNFSSNSLPTEMNLELKVGARVMFVKNDLSGRWVNGTLGTVTKLSPSHVKVKIDDGQEVDVEAEEWEVYSASYDDVSRSIINEIIGSFTQIPLKLSWAITIHKSQGQTFDKVILDLGRGAFTTGQTYVALSRCTSLDGLVLANKLKKSDVRTDYQVSKFLTYLEYSLSEKNLSQEQKVEIIKKAIKNKMKLEITYLKGTNVKDVRQIKPQKIGQSEYQGKEFLALEAYCLLREADRIFNVNRIIKIKLVN